MDITINLGDLASLTKIPAEELKNQLTNAETGEILPSDKISAALSGAMKKRFDSIAEGAAGRSVKDALTKRERKIAEQYGVSDYTDLDDLVSKVAQANKGSFDESKVMQHPSVVSKVKELQQAIKAEKNAAKQLQADFEQKEFNRGFRDYAKQQLHELGYNTENKRAVDAYLRDLQTQAKWKKTETGYIPVDEHGYQIQENHEDVGFGKLVETTTWLPKTGNNNGNNPPPPPGGNGGNNKSNFGKFTSADYADIDSYTRKYKELSKAGEHKAAAELEKQYYENRK